MPHLRSLALVGAVLAATPAHADVPVELVESVIGKALSGGIDQTRRSIAIGPQVGLAAAFDGDGDSGQAISFGLSLYTFDRPSLLDLKERATELLTARVRARLGAATASGEVPASVEQLVEEEGARVMAELEEELAGMRTLRPRLREKPSLKLVLEGLVYLDGGGAGRVGVSKGLGPVSLGLGAGVQRAGGDTAPVVGAELSLHLTPVGRLRTPVLDLYGRGDLVWLDAGRGELFTLGLRATLDVL